MMGSTGTNIDSKNIMSLIQPGSVGAEIGVWKGSSSKQFINRKLAAFYMVDPWAVAGYQPAIDADDETFDYQMYLSKYASLVGSNDPKDFQKYYDNIYAQVCAQFSKYTNVVICRMNSTEWFNTHQSPKLDWIYIDGDHSYTGVINDLNNCLKVMKPDGIILGDDYKWDSKGDKGGVKKAVNEFIEQRGFSINRFGKNQFQIIRS